jgi:acetyltransferase-like isoleucine patch superfamily enzyme
VTWAAASLLLVEGIVFAMALAPAVALVEWSFHWMIAPAALRLLIRSSMIGPAYALFALALMILSAGSTALLRWRTPLNAEMRITDFEWPLLRWVRYLTSSHLVRLCAGALFRATPIWTFYHRLNGARLGRGVYINSLAVVDDNLLDFGDHVVIGAAGHVSGHTVEHGVVKTGPVRLGADVTIGVGAVIGIAVEIGAGAQVGALSVVPKHTRLDGHAAYAGAPVRRLHRAAPALPTDPQAETARRSEHEQARYRDTTKRSGPHYQRD